MALRTFAFLAIQFSIFLPIAFAQDQGKCWRWRRPEHLPPDPRADHAMAYDSRRGVTVLFGGSYRGAETWEYDGTHWSLRALSGPPARWGHAMSFDSIRGVTVLCGGFSVVGGVLNDMWEWNGESWVQKELEGSVPQAAFGSMVFDENRGVTVLFSGVQTWEYNGSSWSLRTDSGPSVRSRPAMAYDSTQHKTLLFGGFASLGPHQPVVYDELWQWDGNEWTLLHIGGPEARHHHTMVYDSSRKRTILFGGEDESDRVPNDVWEWDGATWLRLAGSGPTKRWGHAMVFDDSRGVGVLFGGAGDGLHGQGETWEWNGTNWRLISISGPPRDGSHGMAYDKARKETVLFGWSTTTDSETWFWDGNRWTMRSFRDGPAPGGRMLAYDSSRGVTVLFGGGRDTWEWDGTKWELKSERGPVGRTLHAMAYDAKRGVVVMTGGYDGTYQGVLGGTWEWDGKSWTLKENSSVSARFKHAMAFDSQRGVVVMVGGQDIGGNFPRGVWEWDGSTWTLRNTQIPPGQRQGNQMVFDCADGSTLLYSGEGYGPSLGDTWAWDGDSWKSISLSNGPIPRSFSAMAYDSYRGVTVMFGGFNGDRLGDTWELVNCNTDSDGDRVPDGCDECPRTPIGRVVDGRGCSALPSNPVKPKEVR